MTKWRYVATLTMHTLQVSHLFSILVCCRASSSFSESHRHPFWSSASFEHSQHLSAWLRPEIEVTECTTVRWYIGTLLLLHWYSGTLIHWYTVTLLHWYSGTLTHWYIGILAHWYTGRLIYFDMLIHVVSTIELEAVIDYTGTAANSL